MKSTLDEVFDFLSTTYKIVCGERLTLGNVVETVFHARDEKRDLVVKIGLSDRAAEEVKLNRRGYDSLRSIGATRILPDPLFNADYRGIPIVVMGDCGPDFYHAVRAEADPTVLYKRLIENMNSVYQETRRASSGNGYLHALRSRLIKQYEVHLREEADHALVQEFYDRDLRDLDPPHICFSSFDFTPEDVFVGPFGVKYVDPLPDVLGVPAVDLACFAGVARDAFGLPGAEKGYLLLESFAVRGVSRILDMDERNARRFFFLGRALQCALSARFRLTTDIQKARALTKQSELFLRDFLIFRN
jgi:hypothetical protein